jgi:hypothetical protein
VQYLPNTSSYFRDAEVEYEGRVYSFAAEEGRALEHGIQYWHHEGEPSSWLAVAVFEAVRERMQGVPEAVVLELTARAMGITVEKLRSSIEWHENYMRWHDGDPTYRVLQE